MKTAVFLLAATAILPISAQIGSPVAVAGYRVPADQVTAAPGQVLVVSVFGAAARLAEPVLPVAGQDGLPTIVNGFSVDFAQGPLTVKLGIRALQQTPCLVSGPCSPATSFTLQIPYEFNPDSRTPAMLHFKEAGAFFASALLRGVTDNVHILNTCDQTGIFLGIAVGIPPSVCAPMVMHAGGAPVSSTAPATAGETLVVWAYGLGMPEHPIVEPCCATPEQLPMTAHPVNVSLSYADLGGFPLKRLAQMPATWAGMVGGGLYQVHFVVPELPPDLGQCGSATGNLRVLVTGPTSSDWASICAQR